MEARAEFRQPRISKGLIALVAVSVTLGLGVMAGTVSKNLNGAATTTQTHSVSQGLGGPAVGPVRHGGIQSVEDNAPISTAVGPDDRAGSVGLAPIAGRGVSPDAADRKAAANRTGNAFVAPDAAEHAGSGRYVAAPKWFTPDGIGFRES